MADDVTLLKAMPLMALIVAPVRFAPVIVTGTVVPVTPVGGVMANRDGIKVVMVNVTELLTPFGVVTSTARAPSVAVGSTLNVAVI